MYKQQSQKMKTETFSTKFVLEKLSNGEGKISCNKNITFNGKPLIIKFKDLSISSIYVPYGEGKSKAINVSIDFSDQTHDNSLLKTLLIKLDAIWLSSNKTNQAIFGTRDNPDVFRFKVYLDGRNRTSFYNMNDEAFALSMTETKLSISTIGVALMPTVLVTGILDMSKIITYEGKRYVQRNATHVLYKDDPRAIEVAKELLRRIISDSD